MAVHSVVAIALDDEKIVAGYDWDDVTGDVLRVRCSQQSTRFDVRFDIIGLGSGRAGRSRSLTATAGSGDITVEIPAAQQPRYPVVADGEGGLTIEGYSVRASLIEV